MSDTQPLAPSALWQQTLAHVRPELLRDVYSRQLAGSRVVASNDDVLLVQVQSPRAAAWLNQRLLPLLVATVGQLAGRPVQLVFVEGHSPHADSRLDTDENKYDAKPMTPSERRAACRQSKNKQQRRIEDEPLSIQTSGRPARAIIPRRTLFMTTSNQRIQIASHVSEHRFLYVEDALDTGVLRLVAGVVGQTDEQRAWHRIDLADARVLFRQLAIARDGYAYAEEKRFSPADGKTDICSALHVRVNGARTTIQLKNTPMSTRTAGAAPQTVVSTTRIGVTLTRHDVQRLALELLAFLQAWDVVRMVVYQAEVAQMPPYAQMESTRLATKSD